MLRLGILASTRATDMEAIVSAIKEKKLNAVISVVISNKHDAYALERAKNHSINTVLIDSKGKDREVYDKEISKALDENLRRFVETGAPSHCHLRRWISTHYSNRDRRAL